MKRLLEDIPSFPKIPSMAPLHLGITTRVMAKKQALQRERASISVPNPNKEDESRRRSSKFLEGASIPNSIIRSDLQQPDPVPKDSTTRRRERDEFVKTLTKRFEPEKAKYHNMYNEEVDREALNKIKKELQKRSLLPLTSRHETDKRNSSDVSADTNNFNKDSVEEIKEKRRIARRTSILAPLRGEKHSTYESIKKAIQNSKVMQQLLNADNIEEQKVKLVQSGQSLMPKEETESESTQSNANLKGSRKRERKGSKRKHSLRSEKSFNLPDKLIAKKKGVPDLRKHIK